MFIARLVVALLTASLIGCAAPHSAEPGPTFEPLRVLSYNTHHGQGIDGVVDLQRIAEVIMQAGADLVALQEVDERTRRTGGIDQAGELARLTGMYHAFAPFMDFQGGRYGLAVLSRFPMEEMRVIDLPPGAHEPRTALAITVAPPGHGRLTFVSLHLDWLEPDTNRFAQARALVDALSADSPVILAGDFNDTPESRTMRLFLSEFAEAPKPENARWTFPSDRPEQEIDFIIFRPVDAWTGSSRVLDEEIASDHRPVLAVLKRTSAPCSAAPAPRCSTPGPIQSGHE